MYSEYIYEIPIFVLYIPNSCIREGGARRMTHPSHPYEMNASGWGCAWCGVVCVERRASTLKASQHLATLRLVRPKGYTPSSHRLTVPASQRHFVFRGCSQPRTPSLPGPVNTTPLIGVLPTAMTAQVHHLQICPMLIDDSRPKAC